MALLAPHLVPVSLLMLMIPLNVYVAWREGEALDRSGVTWTTVGRFLGTFGGFAQRAHGLLPFRGPSSCL